LATLVLVVLVLHDAGAAPYRRWIGRGLVACLAGDILLMIPANLFVAGLVAFLVAHLCFIRACVVDGGGVRAPKLPALPVLAATMGVMAYLWPSLGPLRIPVAGYVMAIAVMAWQMIARWVVRRSTGALFAALGSLSFMASDSLLAADRFVAPVTAASLLVLTTYYAAIWGLTASALPARR
jgi:uncharacterized membrane protein YhhN